MTWKVNKEINLGDMLVVGGMASTILVSAFGGYLYLSTRIDKNDAADAIRDVRIETLSSQISNNQADIKDSLMEIKGELKDIRHSIDGKADK